MTLIPAKASLTLRKYRQKILALRILYKNKIILETNERNTIQRSASRSYERRDA